MRAKKFIPILLATVVAYMTFNFFYTVTYTPFYLPTPLAYCAPNDKPTGLIVHAERSGDLIAYEFWYKWPYDGFYHRTDWEPVIVYLKSGKLYAVAVRAHYNWRVDKHPPEEDGRPIITFAYLWHTPLLKLPPPDYVKVNLTPVVANPPEDIDPFEIIKIPSPFNNAFIAALIYTTIAFFATFFVSEYIIRKA